ncbi:cyclodeaminase/cyclohydrolase family protein [Billgrantia sp. LNSP4103-1]|uniref:cyclodeaminase/cyclohydrolase family protein n=1 Tax=Billgrantia sp. LNSP4103-1 TaxID=3410266 RepID=UPI00403EFE16
MSDSVWQWSLTDFRDAIETRGMPGCGAAAAVSAALGMALVLKGLRLSDDRSALISRGDALCEALARLADDDIAVFGQFLAAAKRAPNAAERAGKQEDEMERAVESACRVPLEIARACRDALALSAEALPLTAERFHSDTRAGARLLHAALLAVLAGLEDNLQGLDGREDREALRQSGRALRAEAETWLTQLET